MNWRGACAAMLGVALGLGGAAARAAVDPQQAEAARLLTQATFGPTLPEIQRAARLGAAAWVDEQLQRRPSYHYPLWITRDVANQGHGELQGVWLERATRAPDQLRQRVAFALSEIMVVSSSSDIDPAGLVKYQDILLRDAFGNFRTLLNDVARSMAMGRYLSMYQNRKPDTSLGIRADENFAREVMQLFTIGLVKLNADGTPRLGAGGKTVPTFKQADVENLARIFTGWSSANTPDFYSYPPDWTKPMAVFEDYHDRDAKVFLGRNFAAGVGANAELSRALNVIFLQPNVGPFISRRLIQRLVTSNPTPEYVGRVAAVFADNGSGVRGDLGAVVRAILLDSEARTGAATMPERFGKLREPLLRLTHLWRAFGATGQTGDGHFPVLYLQGSLGQAPLASPSVFNFFQPDYAPDGELRGLGLVAPEMQLATDSLINGSANTFDWVLYNFSANPNLNPDPNYPFVSVNLDAEAALADHPDALLDRLDLLLMNGQMPAAMREPLARRMNDFRYEWDSNAGYWRAREAIFLLINSPQYLVQK